MTQATKERPILMSAPMVKARRAGTKTQTRRVIKPQPEYVSKCFYCVSGWAHGTADDGCTCKEIRCPYGYKGDRLWVRETWGYMPGTTDEQRLITYRATPEPPVGWPARRGDYTEYVVWRPSIFMPRWACRDVLEIVNIRVERVRDISEADAKAEGVEPDHETGGYIDSYMCLWDKLNHSRGYGWDVNPWVWVIDFKAVAL